MENNILTAKEWTIEHSVENRTYIEANRLSTWDAECYKMERYADYKSKMLEAEILTFRLGFIRRWSYLIPELEKEFDSHFNIKKEMQGKINE